MASFESVSNKCRLIMCQNISMILHRREEKQITHFCSKINIKIWLSVEHMLIEIRSSLLKQMFIIFIWLSA